MSVHLLFVCCALAAALAGCGAEPAAPAAAGAGKAPEVAVLTLAVQRFPVRTELPGRVAALRVSEVRPQVSGIIEKRFFEEGSDVKAGDVLYQINDDSYQARFEQADAELAMEKASLVNVRVIAERYQKLVETRHVTLQDEELARANYQQGLAKVKAREAALKAALIDWRRTKVRAAIDGRIGRSAVSEGALVAADQSGALAKIQQLDPIYVDIAQSSQQLTRLQRRLSSGALAPGQSAVTLLTEDGQAYKHAGLLKFTEMSVDADAGVVALRAQFPNPGKLLLPGMYVRANVEQGVQPEVLLLPQQAVRYNEKNQALAWVVNNNNTVEERVLELLGSHGNQWVAHSGVQAGERVIVEGALRMAPGLKVRPVAWSAPARVASADSSAAPGKR